MRIFSSPIYMALAALLLLYLSMRVSLLRMRYGVVLGDGGHDDLLRAIRVQANFIEYVPIALLLILAADLVGHDKWIIHVLGIALLVGRVCHAYGLSRDPGRSPGRMIGVTLTYLVLIAGAILAILSFFNIRV
jgi:uncharacterized membrane protein YecN with MAPEG domain